MIYPSATDSTHCWDAGTPESLTRDGGGDTQSLVQMVCNIVPVQAVVLISGSTLLTQISSGSAHLERVQCRPG